MITFVLHNMGMANFRWRFRKSFTIIPHFLKFTINKKSWSLNFKCGPYSRSWGSARSISTVDMPGTYGLSVRKEQKQGQGGFDALIVVGSILTVFFHFIILAGGIIGWNMIAGEEASFRWWMLIILLIVEVLMVAKFKDKAWFLFSFLTLGSAIFVFLIIKFVII